MELEIKEYATVLKKRLWLILLVVAVVCVLVGFYSYRMVEPQYEASNKMIVTNKTEEKSLSLVQMIWIWGCVWFIHTKKLSELA